ncbi:hypothetical protein M569_05798 [Genlisea aurea]|uniref:Uncharacterized protein n=1 Tax=Genlisea aurea TaxID=192259 RepID=S8CQG1_9LAMI|nr:hypothetical protein M569_05798 [Genlisea aurea]
MDPSPLPPASPSAEEDEWDADGFVIPSLGIDEEGWNDSKTKDSKPSEAEVPPSKEENIYLGPHGVPPWQAKQIIEGCFSRKQGQRQRINQANRRYGGSGRENKVDSLRELMGPGNGKMSSLSSSSSKGRSRGDWLEPHCDEAQFERRP